jgi:LacI family transcriptional regulator
MACNDPRGQKVLEACRRLALKVPEEIAVIGVDNDEPVCEIADPPLTSVVPDAARLGFEAASLLDRMIRKGFRPKRPVFLPPVGVVTRQSTDVLAFENVELAAALRLIRRYACDGLGVDDVVRELSISRSTLQRQFKAALGRTIHDEFILARLSQAKHLLSETELTIAAIARRCGFRHQEYMGYVFRTRLSQTPAEYRRQARGVVRP